MRVQAAVVGRCGAQRCAALQTRIQPCIFNFSNFQERQEVQALLNCLLPIPHRNGTTERKEHDPLAAFQIMGSRTHPSSY
jgi:hypothetical protein